jgi:hypothetical protein
MTTADLEDDNDEQEDEDCVSEEIENSEEEEEESGSDDAYDSDFVVDSKYEDNPINKCLMDVGSSLACLNLAVFPNYSRVQCFNYEDCTRAYWAVKDRVHKIPRDFGKGWNKSNSQILWGNECDKLRLDARTMHYLMTKTRLWDPKTRICSMDWCTPKDLVDPSFTPRVASQKELHTTFIFQAVLNRYWVNDKSNLGKDPEVKYMIVDSKNETRRTKNPNYTFCFALYKDLGMFFCPYRAAEGIQDFNSERWLKLDPNTGQPQLGSYVRKIDHVMAITVPKAEVEDIMDCWPKTKHIPQEWFEKKDPDPDESQKELEARRKLFGNGPRSRDRVVQSEGKKELAIRRKAKSRFPDDDRKPAAKPAGKAVLQRGRNKNNEGSNSDMQQNTANETKHSPPKKKVLQRCQEQGGTGMVSDEKK